jgi:uncharacterized membrane protein YcgQ (UPF0703/DUF1980 family)
LVPIIFVSVISALSLAQEQLAIRNSLKIFMNFYWCPPMYPPNIFLEILAFSHTLIQMVTKWSHVHMDFTKVLNLQISFWWCC